jgi:hypothetical protein
MIDNQFFERLVQDIRTNSIKKRQELLKKILVLGRNKILVFDCLLENPPSGGFYIYENDGVNTIQSSISRT